MVGFTFTQAGCFTESSDQLATLHKGARVFVHATICRLAKPRACQGAQCNDTNYSSQAHMALELVLASQPAGWLA